MGVTLKKLGLAAALIAMTAGSAAVAAGGCSGGDATGASSGATDTMEVTVAARPLLDQQAPTEFQTATFAFG
jgi:hypothetical protein